MRHERRGFTLVELLIVLAIIALLAALVAFTLPGFQERQRAAKGASALQGYLNYARQRALFEQSPRGVRFLIIPNTATGGYVVSQCQYLEKPDDFVGRPPPGSSAVGKPLITDSSDPTPDTPRFLKLHPLVVAGGFNFSDGSVEPGDYFEAMETGQIHQIIAVTFSDPTKPAILDKLILGSTLPHKIYASMNPMSTDGALTNYRIQRRPRVAGDEAYTMPDGVVVDLGFYTSGHPNLGIFSGVDVAYRAYMPTWVLDDAVPPTPKKPQFFDIMFGPNGSVLEANGAMIVLWVRTEDGKTIYDKNPTLLVITVNSGAVSAYDPTPGANPYAKVQ